MRAWFVYLTTLFEQKRSWSIAGNWASVPSFFSTSNFWEGEGEEEEGEEEEEEEGEEEEQEGEGVDDEEGFDEEATEEEGTEEEDKVEVRLKFFWLSLEFPAGNFEEDFASSFGENLGEIFGAASVFEAKAFSKTGIGSSFSLHRSP